MQTHSTGNAGGDENNVFPVWSWTGIISIETVKLS